MMPAIVPTNTPHAAFSDAPPERPTRSSPSTAPTNEPRIMPNGGNQIMPASIPSTEAHTPARDAPAFFAPQPGTT